MKCAKESLRLYAVTDRSWLGSSNFAVQVEAALRGGVSFVQLREKDCDEQFFMSEALIIKELCQRYQVPFIINDNVDVAIACQADGIHVGQSDMMAANVRSLIKEELILGVSVQNVEQALLAQEMGADYLGVGAVFSTSTKLDADDVSYETLKAICDSVAIPVVAIGGINKSNMMKLKGSGIEGVALVSAIFASENIENECKNLRKLVDEVIHDED